MPTLQSKIIGLAKKQKNRKHNEMKSSQQEKNKTKQKNLEMT